MLVVLAIAAAPDPVRAQASALDPSQRDWKYTDHADVKTGELYPAVFLMSRTPIPLSDKSAGVGHGYLGVSNHPKRSFQVTASWDVPSSKADLIKCKVARCQLKIRFGTAAAIPFVAVQSQEHPSVLTLQDPQTFIAAAERHVGPIEVQFETATNGLVAYQVWTSSPLQVGKLAGRRR